MTLHPTPVRPVPAETIRIARAAVPKGTSYLQMRDVLGTIYADEQFADLFATRGRPVLPPWRLALAAGAGNGHAGCGRALWTDRPPKRCACASTGNTRLGWI
jgi:hypothetical protein